MGSPFRRKWLALGWAFLIIVIVGSLMPNPPSPDLQYGDKLEHLCAYFVLMNWFAQAVPRRRVLLAVGIVAFGVAIEFLQGMTAWRSYDIFDMAANAMGVLLGWLAAPPRGPDLYARVAAYASRGMP